MSKIDGADTYPAKRPNDVISLGPDFPRNSLLPGSGLNIESTHDGGDFHTCENFSPQIPTKFTNTSIYWWICKSHRYYASSQWHELTLLVHLGKVTLSTLGLAHCHPPTTAQAWQWQAGQGRRVRSTQTTVWILARGYYLSVPPYSPVGSRVLLLEFRGTVIDEQFSYGRGGTFDCRRRWCNG